MANSIPSGIIIEYDNSGGTLVNISQHVQTINEVGMEQLLEETHTFGDSWEEHKPIGIGKIDPVELGGLYDDTASTGPDALFVRSTPDTPASTLRTLKITWVGTKTTAVETWLVTYKRSADRSGLTKYTATLQPTGAVTET